MNTLSPNIFKSTFFIYSEIKRFLKSFDAANMIDEGEFPTYVKHILDSLGLGVYKEEDTILHLKNKKAKLPDNFKSEYFIYKCNPLNNVTKDILQSQFKFRTEVSVSLLTPNCFNEYEYVSSNKKEIVEEISFKTYVSEKDKIDFKNFMLLVPSTNVGTKLKSRYNEYSIKDGYIYTNISTKDDDTDDDYLYIRYYSFPVDSDGNIEILDIQQLENCIKWYIIYQILLSNWFNSAIPDIQNKWQKAEQEYNKALGEVKYYLKLPQFKTLVNTIRTNRSNNKMVFFTKQYYKNGFQ